MPRHELDLRHSRFRDAIATIAAPIHGVPKDELEGDDIRAYRRLVLVRRSAVVALLVLFAGVAVAASLAVIFRGQTEEEKALRVTVEALNSSLEEANSELEQTNGELDATNEQLDRANAELVQTNIELDQANGNLRLVNDELDTANRALEQTNADLEQANGELQATNLLLTAAKDELEKVNEDLVAAERWAAEAAGWAICYIDDGAAHASNAASDYAFLDDQVTKVVAQMRNYQETGSLFTFVNWDDMINTLSIRQKRQFLLLACKSRVEDGGDPFPFRSRWTDIGDETPQG